MSDNDRLLVVIAGPTAAGKTALAIDLAIHFHTEILSADSRQFYREMIIGTASPTDDELSLVRHHFIRHRSVHEPWNVSGFETEAVRLMEDLFMTHRILFLVGGSGLYIDAVCHGLDTLPDPDPEIRCQLKETLAFSGVPGLFRELERLDPVYAARVDRSNPARLIRALEVCRITGIPYTALLTNTMRTRSFRILKIALEMPRENLFNRINARVDAMILAGLADEARYLLPFRDQNALNTVGYQELFDHFTGRMTLDQAIEKIKVNTRRYAKRQLTWFRKDPEYHWFAPGESEKITGMIRSQLGSR